MTISIDIHTNYFAPWEEGAAERERIDEWSETLTFDNAREAADWLTREGFDQPSETGPYNRRTWLEEHDPYEDPYTNVLRKRAAHFEGAGPNENPRLWAAIVATVSRDWTHYTGPYYVERVNVFGVKL